MWAPSEALLKLKHFFTNAPEGASITYAEIAEATGVPMDTSGKQLMRRAIASVDREYLCQRGHGITLDAPQTTMPILATRSQRIGSSLKRASKAATRLSHYYPKLPEPERRQALFIGSVFGAMLASSKMLEQQYLTPNTTPHSTPAMIPATYWQAPQEDSA